MIDYDLNAEIGIEAARIFDEISQSDVLLAASTAESFLNERANPSFRHLAIASFNQAVNGGVEAKLIRLGQDCFTIMLDLAPPLSAQWFSMIDTPDLNCQWSEPSFNLAAI